MLSTIAIALTLVTTAAAPGETLLDICRGAYESFEPKAAVKSCSAAADVDELSVTQRVQALRYLAQSHILANEDDEAARAFTRMLVLDDALLLTRDAGPRERDVFARARAGLEKKGRIAATHVVDEVGRVRVELRDPLARVAGARVRVRSGERMSVGLLSGTRSGDTLVLDGALPVLTAVSEVRYEIVLDGHSGAPLAVDAPLRGTHAYPGVVGADAPAAPASLATPAPSAVNDIGYAVLASGIGLEAGWLFLATPVVAATFEAESAIPIALVGAAVFGGIIAIGAGMALSTPEPPAPPPEPPKPAQGAP